MISISEQSRTIHPVRKGIPLRALSDHSDHLDMVRKRDLRPGDWVFVSTRNSLYCIYVLGGDAYRVSGGWFDRMGMAPYDITINGCTWGGSALKQDVVAARGLFLEFGNQVLTTRIRSINVFLSEAMGQASVC